ncbi:MAG: hypothetical protein ACYCUM_02115 [Solirubrobacteraceae bacterium]
MSTTSMSWLSPVRRPGQAPGPDRGEQLAWERRIRSRLGVPAAVGGVLYLLSGIIVSSALSSAPTVGLLQALKGPIVQGIAEPASSPRTAEVRYVSEHAFALIVGSALSAIALLMFTAVLLVLVRACRHRRPESWAPTAMLVLIGGIGFAAVSIGHQIAEAILTHQFVASADHGNEAVKHALTTGTTNVVSDYVSLIAGLFFAAGMITASLNAMRVGLLARWMGIVGALSGLLIFLPIGGAELEIIPAFWLVAMGILMMGRWPNGDPPAWEAGEAIPWPSQAERMQTQRGARGGARGANATRERAQATAVAASSGDASKSAAAGKRRRKHGSRR